MEDEVISLVGNIFMVKGNNVEVFSGMALAKFNPETSIIEGGKYQGPTHQRIKELLDKGYELAVDDGAEKGQAFKKAINNANIMPGSTYMNFYGDTGNKLLKNVKSIGRGLGKILPSIAGFSSIPGAIASGLLYAGTSKPAGAGSAPMDYFNTPFEPQGFMPTSPSPQISESFDRDPVVFDRYMQNKIQNLKNNEGIMRARTKPQAPPGQPVTGPHIGYNTGGIVSLIR
jgi:hypothetical protein